MSLYELGFSGGAKIGKNLQELLGSNVCSPALKEPYLEDLS